MSKAYPPEVISLVGKLVVLMNRESPPTREDIYKIVAEWDEERKDKEINE